MHLQHAGAAADRAPHSVFAWLDIIAMLHIYAQDGMRSRRALKCWGRCAQQMHRAVQQRRGWWRVRTIECLQVRYVSSTHKSYRNYEHQLRTARHHSGQRQ